MNFPSTVPGDIALVVKAIAFAEEAHRGHERSYTGAPYLTHLLNVAHGVATRTMDPHIIAAAVLHDTLEDTEAGYAELLHQFGERVASIVRELTDVYTTEAYPDLNRRERKALEAKRLGTISAEAQLIKAYDLINNTESITHYDPGFAKVYLAEKRQALSYMGRIDPHERALLKTSLEG